MGNQMANTYTQIYLQFVFAVQNRVSLITKEWKSELYKYITGIVQTSKHKMLAINGTANHIHIFVGYKPHQPIPDLLRDIKGSSSMWINEKKLVKGRFNWQGGYGAFSYGQSQIGMVVRYIRGQEEHHRERTFREEYKELLDRFEIEHDDRYILEDVV